MSGLCINCGVFFGPGFVSLVLLIWAISSKVIDWHDLKKPGIMIVEIGIIILALSLGWMYLQIFHYETIDYLLLFAPSLIGLGITSVGVLRLRRDTNFTGLDWAYAGIGLFLGALFWIFWVFEAFS
ncbi:MAG: hypothetical protein JXA10_15295 [Anaerolineae bacterium]|nr:hypothetical protein [Anaerolineae bacterium]